VPDSDLGWTAGTFGTVILLLLVFQKNSYSSPLTGKWLSPSRRTLSSGTRICSC